MYVYRYSDSAHFAKEQKTALLLWRLFSLCIRAAVCRKPNKILCVTARYLRAILLIDGQKLVLKKQNIAGGK